MRLIPRSCEPTCSLSPNLLPPPSARPALGFPVKPGLRPRPAGLGSAHRTLRLLGPPLARACGARPSADTHRPGRQPSARMSISYLPQVKEHLTIRARRSWRWWTCGAHMMIQYPTPAQPKVGHGQRPWQQVLTRASRDPKVRSSPAPATGPKAGSLSAPGLTAQAAAMIQHSRPSPLTTTGSGFPTFRHESRAASSLPMTGHGKLAPLPTKRSARRPAPPRSHATKAVPRDARFVA
jgi:hypothetical protein